MTFILGDVDAVTENLPRSGPSRRWMGEVDERDPCTVARVRSTQTRGEEQSCSVERDPGYEGLRSRPLKLLFTLHTLVLEGSSSYSVRRRGDDPGR